MLENIAAGLICTAICAIARRIYLSAKAANLQTETEPPRKLASKKTLRKQFFVSFFILVSSSIIAPAIPFTGLISMLKIWVYMAFGLSLIITWGAFEAAFVFYPNDESAEEEPTEHATSHAGKD